VSDRFEVLPFGRAEEEAARLTEHVRLTVTASPTHTLDQTVETGTRLRGLGHELCRIGMGEQELEVHVVPPDGIIGCVRNVVRVHPHEGFDHEVARITHDGTVSNG